jgi:hypothetical protein
MVLTQGDNSGGLRARNQRKTPFLIRLTQKFLLTDPRFESSLVPASPEEQLPRSEMRPLEAPGSPKEN